MQRLKFVLAGLLFASPAFAQGEGETPPDPATEGGEAATTETGGGAGAGVEGTVDAGATASTGMWSRSVVDRPYIVGKSKFAAYGTYGITKFSFTDPITMTSLSFTGDVLGVGGAYGVTDKINAGLQYSIAPGIIGDGEFEAKGGLDLFGNYQLVHDGKLDVTVSADFGLNLCGASDPMTGDCTATKALHAGLGARYNLAPKMAVYTGAPYGPGPVGQHLSISLESDGPITFELPVGFMYQATPELNVHLATTLANISISNSDTAIFGADYIPLSLGALYSINPNLDVTGMFTLFDLKEIGFDAFAFGVGARYYAN